MLWPQVQTLHLLIHRWADCCSETWGSLKPKTVLSGISCETGKEICDSIRLCFVCGSSYMSSLQILKHSYSAFLVLSLAYCWFPTRYLIYWLFADVFDRGLQLSKEMGFCTFLKIDVQREAKASLIGGEIQGDSATMYFVAIVFLACISDSV